MAILRIALASLIEGHWRIFILWLFVIGFNLSNVYVFLYAAPTYCDVSIGLYVCYRIRAYVRILVIILFFVKH